MSDRILGVELLVVVSHYHLAVVVVQRCAQIRERDTFPNASAFASLFSNKSRPASVGDTLLNPSLLCCWRDVQVAIAFVDRSLTISFLVSLLIPNNLGALPSPLLMTPLRVSGSALQIPLSLFVIGMPVTAMTFNHGLLVEVPGVG